MNNEISDQQVEDEVQSRFEASRLSTEVFFKREFRREKQSLISTVRDKLKNDPKLTLTEAARAVFEKWWDKITLDYMHYSSR